MTTADSGLLYELVPRAALPDLEYLAALAAAEARVTDWDRYEAQLPQDGFGLVGLYCRACLNGPCRVSPFGRPGEDTKRAKRGVCGFGAEEMSLAFLAQTIGRGLASIAASAWSGPASVDLFSTAGRLLAAIRPGQGSAQDIVDAVKCAALEAAGGLADIGKRQQALADAPEASAPVGLGHLEPGVSRALIIGGDWSDAQTLSRVVSAAAKRSVQLCASSAVAGAYEAGIPVVIDGASVPLLAQSRLVDTVIDGPAAASDALDRCSSQSSGRQDLPRPDAGGPSPAGRMRVWSGSAGGLFVAGTSKVRSALGRGGYHQAMAREGCRRGLKVIGLGDGAYYLSPLAAELGIEAASLARALPVLLRNQADGRGEDPESAPVLVAFPEPALPEELAAALALAASGIAVFLGGELPLTATAAALVEQAFGSALWLGLSLGRQLPPATPAARDRLDAAAAWFAAVGNGRSASRQ